MQRSWVIGRNSLLNGLDLVGGLASGILCSVLVARAMGPDLLGEYNYITWVVFVAGYLASVGLPSAVKKFASEHYGAGHPEKAESVIRFTFWLQSLLGVVVAAIGMAVGHAWLPADQFAYAAPAILSTIPVMALGSISMANAAREDFQPNVVASIVSNLVILAVTLATLRFGWGLPGLTLAILASRSVDLAVRYAGFRLQVGSILWRPGRLLRLEGFAHEEKRQYLRFCGEATILMVIQMIVWGRSEVWFLKQFWPPAEVSFYSLGFNFTDKVNMIPVAVAGAVSASLMVEFGRSPQAAGRLAITSLRYLALLTLPLLAGMAALSRPLIVALYSHPFLPAVAPLVVQCILLTPRSLLTPASDLLVAADRQRDMVRWGLVMCVVNLGLDWWWIRGGGAMGAAWANGVAQILATVITWWLALRAYRLRFPFGALGRILASSTGMGLAVWALARSLPPVAALVMGVPAGALIYFILLRLTGSLNADDGRRLLALNRLVPGPLRPAYGSLLARLAG